MVTDQTPTTTAVLTPPGGPDPVPQQSQRSPMSAALVVALLSVSVLSGVAAFAAIYAVGLSGLQEQRSQHQLYAAFRGVLDPSSPIAPKIGGVITPGTPIALINSPQAGLHNAVVVEGTSSSDLLKGPGHLRDSPLPGQIGQSIVMGKSLTAGGPFRGITKLVKGDVITVVTGQSTFRFVVDGERAGGDPLPVVPSGGALLTLMTSTGSGWLGSVAPSHVVSVDATLQGTAVTAPAGRPVAVPVAELPGRNDPSGWPFLVLWLQALLATGVAAVWSWNRWGRWQTWLVTTPIVLGVLWGASEEALRLLPNLM
jgi:sortase A